MAEFVLLNSGDFVLLNSGDKVLLNGEVEVEVEAPKTSISHVTLDAGIDLRRRKNSRSTQILKLSIEVPTTGTTIKKQKLIVDCEGSCKVTTTSQSSSLSLHLPLLEKQSIPLTCTALSKQKTLCSVTGTKYYHKTLVKNTQLQRKITKIDTLMKLLRMIDED